MSPCLSEDLLAGLVSDELTPEELLRVRQHAMECRSCLDLLNACLCPEEPELSRILPPGAGIAAPEVPFAVTEVAEKGAWKAPRPFLPPREFDEFSEVELIGKGAMGEVYRARDVVLGRTVAVKFLVTSDPQGIQRFQQEARAIASLNHPNILHLYRIGELSGRPYLVSEWIEGQRLDAMPLPMPWDRVLHLGLGMARGLSAAHRNRILHRDIKPSNIMVRRDDEVKVLDFGLAKPLGAAMPARGAPPTGSGLAGGGGSRSLEGTDPAMHPGLITEVGWRVGTPRYMAPEVYRGQGATYASDVFSLGLVLYELCAGTLPRRTVDDRSTQEEDGASGELPDLPPLLSQAPSVSAALAGVVDRCVRNDPAERFATGEALREALERLTGYHSAALPEGNPYRGLRPFEAEHRALFFGRGSDIRAVLDRMRTDPMVLIAGDSGVGKSSLCRAGIIPHVLLGALSSKVNFTSVSLLPGARPLQTLSVALSPILRMNEQALCAWMRSDPSALGRALRETQKKRTATLVFIDQTEELITLSDPAEAALFAQLLAELSHPTPHVRVLLTVRADFLTRLATLPGLGDQVQRALYLLRPLGREGISEAVLGPARSLGFRFEPEAQVVDESVALGPGGLPLLQFALAELWEERDLAARCIAVRELGALGGMAGALSRHADGVLQALPPRQQQAARHILIQLISESGTRTRRGEAELGLSEAEGRTALQALVGGRLLFATQEGGAPVYELAHEVLIGSWGTLRGWLAADADKRALLNRVSAAAAEWERLGQRGEALWSRRQLKEVDALGQKDLPSREGAFLLASRRAERRRRLLAPLLLVSVAALFLLSHALRVREERQIIEGSLAAARVDLFAGRSKSAEAALLRPTLYGLFARQPTEADIKWPDVLALEQDAEAALQRAGSALEVALLRDGGHREVRALLAEVIQERALLADRLHQNRDPLIQRLVVLDPARARKLSAPARLHVRTTPPGARLQARKYQDRGGLRELPVDAVALGTTPLSRVALDPGSYVLTVTVADRPPVQVPVLLDPGEDRQLDIVIPAHVPPGYVYVPPGEFLFGSNEAEPIRKFLNAHPLHPVQTAGYLIARDEVTFAQWIDFLQALPDAEQRKRMPKGPNHKSQPGIRLLKLASGRWQLFFREGGPEYHPVTGEPLHYDHRDRRAVQDWTRFPVSGVSSEDAEAYLSWLDHSGRLQGARLCDEHEWERAARGADGRRFPTGDRILPDDANYDVTYARRSFGPDEVGAHPRSTSPHGLHDMMGNAAELVRSLYGDDVVVRGGSWYQEESDGQINNRNPAEKSYRRNDTGFRVCASVSP